MQPRVTAGRSCNPSGAPAVDRRHARRGDAEELGHIPDGEPLAELGDRVGLDLAEAALELGQALTDLDRLVRLR